MPQSNPSRLRHLLITGTANTEFYTSPATGGGSKSKLPPRQRQAHGQRLLNQLNNLRQEAEKLLEEQIAFGVDAGNGICLQFESEPDFDLKLESLEVIRSGIELLAVTKEDSKTLATVFVPEGKLSFFIKRITAYMEKDTEKGRPRHQQLVESISAIRRAVLNALWTDDNDCLPEEDSPIWWEVWLRVGSDRKAIVDFFNKHAERIGLTVGQEQISFPDRTVVTALGTKAQMSRSINLLNCIAELRKTKETAAFFTAMGAEEQFEWVKEALTRIDPPQQDSTAICILDSGINNEHPLLRPALDAYDMHAYDPAWGEADHDDHGTEMAGLALYGDLTELLSHYDRIALSHRLESVKILPPHGINPPHLYGDITAEAIARSEVTAPHRSRIVCMAVSTIDFRDRGRPSSWSARLDALSSGADDEKQRLIIVAAGNTAEDMRYHYPDSNLTDGIHDPGQAWNTVTVGAFTEKGLIDPEEYPGWNLVAPHGDLSPSSCTSMIWQRPWPLKPDIVMEGGNMAIDPTAGNADYVDSLDLLSTGREYIIKPLVTMRETSAATALASRMAAMLQAAYPEYWPETIRALLVHSAEWTEAMQARFQPLNTKNKYEQLLRYCGFGVPNLQRAMWSARNSLTLIAQDSLQPFDKKQSRYVTRDLNLHTIPWPKEVLQDLGEILVEMRVTLSYFIEPNPARRGWTRRYSYASHGLRFDVKRPLEKLDDFRGRINRAARDEGMASSSSSSTESDNWLLGTNLRKLGSLHSDRWTGTAAELAERGYIAVYPVIGWWRERHHLERWSKRARYSLVVSIRTPEEEVDLYTPVANMIRPQIEVNILT